MVSFVPASIERMSRLYIHSGNEFDVMSEAFYPIIFDRNSAKGDELLNTNPELFMPVRQPGSVLCQEDQHQQSRACGSRIYGLSERIHKRGQSDNSIRKYMPY